MKTYTCICGQLIFFQNVICVNCGREIGFLPEALWLSSLEPANDNSWRPTTRNDGKRYRKCQNYSEFGVCNWMIPQDATDEGFCVSCRLNEVIPDLSVEKNCSLWALIEGAKRRLVYSLIRLRLPIKSKKDDPLWGIGFRFLSDVVNPDGSTSKVMTGHERGVITLNVAEADNSLRETVRSAMKEPYRTLLGHFRHEVGHHYWDCFVYGARFLEPFRELFGDERVDYAQALSKYYQSGAPPNWQDSYISAYATSHPWEDWAETWAHFLHIYDTLEVANDFGLAGKRILENHTGKFGNTWLSSKQTAFEKVIESWAELSVALNSINRSMGLPDLYPFVLSRPVIAKLHFVYQVIVAESGDDGPAPQLELWSPAS